MRALITGGSRGIGKAVSDRLVADGWSTIDLSRTTGHDVTEPGTIWQTFATIKQLDAVICSAGAAARPTPLAELTEQTWFESFDVNVHHQFRVLREVASSPWFRGPVVLIASTAGLRPSPEWAPYAAAKAALVNLGLTAAEELAPRGVRVYVLAPGRCATALRATLAPDEDPTTIMQPADVADVVAQCIADEAGVLAGQVIEVKRRAA